MSHRLLDSRIQIHGIVIRIDPFYIPDHENQRHPVRYDIVQHIHIFPGRHVILGRNRDDSFYTAAHQRNYIIPENRIILRGIMQ